MIGPTIDQEKFLAWNSLNSPDWTYMFGSLKKSISNSNSQNGTKKRRRRRRRPHTYRVIGEGCSSNVADLRETLDGTTGVLLLFTHSS